MGSKGKKNKRNKTATATPQKAMQPLQGHEDAWEMKRTKLGRALNGFYTAQVEEDEKACEICGEVGGQLYKMDNGLLMCSSCMGSEIASIQEAAELLFTTYGNFKRLFREVTFRYPALKMAELSMHNIENIKPRGKNRSDLVKMVDSRDSWMSICVVQDIPHCLLEELYVLCFSEQVLMGGRELRSSSEPPKIFSNSGESTKYYLDRIGREKQASQHI